MRKKNRMGPTEHPTEHCVSCSPETLEASGVTRGPGWRPAGCPHPPPPACSGRACDPAVPMAGGRPAGPRPGLSSDQSGFVWLGKSGFPCAPDHCVSETMKRQLWSLFPRGPCACILSSDCALPVRGGARARCWVLAEGWAPGGDRCGQELGSDRAAAGPGVGGASWGPASVAGRPVVSLRVALCSWSSLSCVGERQQGPELTLACQFRQGQGSWPCRVYSVIWEASGTSS